MSEQLLLSVRLVVREELEPVRLAQQSQADNLMGIGAAVGKLEEAINGNGRPGVREEIAGIKRGCRLRHGSGPPPPDDRASVVDLEIARAQTSWTRWKVAGAIILAVIASVASPLVAYAVGRSEAAPAVPAAVR